jgi:putative ABC transport system ATP-binding protein
VVIARVPVGSPAPRRPASRPARWSTAPTARRSSTYCAASTTRRRTTIALITHDRGIAARVPRRIELRDARIVRDFHEEVVA